MDLPLTPNNRRARDTALSVLNELAIESPPVNPLTAARSQGTEVVFVRFTGEYERVSGFYDPDEHQIYINQDEWGRRQTFTIAHELGHALLHKEWAGSDAYSVLWRDQDRNNSGDVYEVEANTFAANLLVPRFMLDKYYNELGVGNLSKLFAVSVPVIQHRLWDEYGIRR